VLEVWRKVTEYVNKVKEYMVIFM